MIERHIPVLLKEVLALLQIRTGGRYIDCTVGGGGHAEAILRAGGDDAKLLGIDADHEAMAAAGGRLFSWREQVTLVRSNFRFLQSIAQSEGFIPADGILFDLGVSSMQLGEGDRGFSFQYEAPLDMRFDSSRGRTAADVVNLLPEKDLADIVFRYGEERRSRQIARAIVRARPLYTSKQLAEVIETVVGRGKSHIHPATRTFQAIRISVNDEMLALEAALPQALDVLRPGGRVAVISFHSLEDRLVKQFFHLESQGCICPPRTPMCVCDHHPRVRVITPKTVRPSDRELSANPRSRSARLRVAEVLAA